MDVARSVGVHCIHAQCPVCTALPVKHCTDCVRSPSGEKPHLFFSGDLLRRREGTRTATALEIDRLSNTCVWRSLSIAFFAGRMKTKTTSCRKDELGSLGEVTAIFNAPDTSTRYE